MTQPANSELWVLNAPEPPWFAGGRGFLASFVISCVASVALLYFALAILRFNDRLPPPPVSGTWCIDSRFAWLKQTSRWREASLLAVGSSTTWRNLDFTAVSSNDAKNVPVNAAPCFLTMNQTRYMAEYLLERVPGTKTLLTVLTLRDVEGCSRNRTDFFDKEVADQHIERKSYDWWLYFRNFRLKDILLHAVYASERRPLMQYDTFGSGPLMRDTSDTGHRFEPESACYSELTRLADVLEAKGVQFIVVTFPIMSGWAERHDSAGVSQAKFRAGVEAALGSTSAIVVDGMKNWHLPDTSFTDPLHLQWPQTAAFTRFVWQAAHQQGAHLPPLRYDSAFRTLESGISPLGMDTSRASANAWSGRRLLPSETENIQSMRSLRIARDEPVYPDGIFAASSVAADAVFQNAPGYSEGYAVGVPRDYEWCSGSYKPPNNTPPPDFTAVTGWGQIYPEVGSPPAKAADGKFTIANAKTYVRLKSSREWVMVQDQSQTPLAGGFFPADFAQNAGIPMQLTLQRDGSVTINSPPVGYNAHFWIESRGQYAPGSVDFAYVQMDIKTNDREMHFVANAGADWWRDPTAKFLTGFSNNPGAGMSNWIRLSTEWTTLRFYSSSASELLADPPPPLMATAGPTIARKRASLPSPCKRKLH